MALSKTFIALCLTAGSAILAGAFFAQPPAVTRPATEFAVTPAEFNRETSTGPSVLGYVDAYGLISAERRALLLQAAVERRFDQVTADDVVEFLVREGREKEAVPLAIDTMRARPEQIADIASALMRVSESIAYRKKSGGLEALAAARSELMSRAAARPREEAAYATYTLLELERTLNRHARQAAPEGSEPAFIDIAAQLGPFIRDYAGASAAVLAELDLFLENPGSLQNPGSAATLERYARDYPGTVAGAKALFHLGYNHRWAERGQNVPARLRASLDIVTQLTSGGFPPCEWVTRAWEQQLLLEDYEAPKLTQQEFDSVVATYRDFILARLNGPVSTQDGNIGVLMFRLPGLFHARHVAGGMERVFDDLIRNAKNPDAARILRAAYDFQHLRWDDQPDDSAFSVARAKRTLEEISRSADAPLRQQALLMLATHFSEQREFEAAAAVYQRYLDEFPEKDQAWVAAIMLGHVQANARDFEASRQSFHRAAAAYESHPVGRIAALAFAAETSAALGDFEAEITDLQSALAAWRPELGPSFVLASPFMGLLDRRPPKSVATELRRDALSARASMLPGTLTRPAGRGFETALWRFRHGEWDGALPPLEGFSRDSASPFRAEAAALARRARLERALGLIDAAPQWTGESRVVREFEALALEANDFTGVAARIARAALAWRQLETDEARQWMRDGLDTWFKLQQNVPSPKPRSLENDVLAIREFAFGRGGPQDLRPSDPNNHRSPYRMAPSITAVTLSDDRREQITIVRAPDGLPNVLFLTPEHEALLTKILESFGANGDQYYAALQGTPRPGQILTLFQEFCPAAPIWNGAGWNGWDFYGTRMSIHFLDELRAKAQVSLDSRSSGMGVLLEKRNGAWTLTKNTSYWVE